ncbi:DUF4825 domain-containing protein [Oscillibacter valericigenes]|uniref:DUF4825 domain-containing protein n=1 Tax=Oscillibacter valericigenes TaxID=351091 RepID=UPI00195BA894|nr:DUF4825 domain-containing protein [Oscillibacter valericigenes]MBM6909663.1 DUF4825 domain-containing protein [Oscillibacter valericigenes]
MKNIPELPCAIVGDLLPAYVEGLTSEETTAAVEAHLASCPACAAKRAAMGTEEGPSPEEAAETAREVDYLKAVRRRSRRRVAAAILCTVLVLLLGFAAKIFVIGTPLNPGGVAVDTQEEGGALQVGISSLGSGNAFRDWTVDNQDGVVSITGRSVLVSPLFRDGTGTVEVPLEGVTEIWLGEAGQGRIIWQEGTEISPDAWALYQAQTPYVGDNSAVGRVLAAVDTWYGPYIEYTISLQTDQEPYGLTIHFDDVTAHILGAGKSIDDRMYAVAPALLALIGNLGQVQWTYAAPDGTAVTRSVTLEEVDAALPDWIAAYDLDAGADWTAPESVKDYAASPAAVQQLIDLIDFGLYVVTVEDGTNVFTPWP